LRKASELGNPKAMVNYSIQVTDGIEIESNLRESYFS
jgi:hypothetical protein